MASVSPAPKSKLGWIIVGVAALGLVCCGGPMVFMGILGLGAKGQKDKQVKQVEEERPIEVSAVQLLQEYKDNEARSNDKYKGKVVQVSGQIDRITEGFVKLKGGQYEILTIDCQFSDDDRKTVASLSSGSQVTIKGMCDGKGFGGINVRKCKLVR